MFDIPPAIETYCGTEVAEIVQYVDPIGSSNIEKVRTIYEHVASNGSFANIADPCQDSLMNYLLSLIDGKQSDDYINAVINQISSAIFWSSVYPDTIKLVTKKIPLIKYQYNPSFSNIYFALLIDLDYPISDEIRNLNITNDEELWDKNLYLAHNGDVDAIKYLRFYINSIEDAPTVSRLLESLLNIKKNIRDPIFSDFIQDSRILYGVEKEYNTTIGAYAEHYLTYK